jgi:hypothetical protein
MMRKPVTILAALALGACAYPPPPDRGGDDRIEVTGVLTDEGVECRALRGRDGRLYTLAGSSEPYKTGDVVTVRGTVAEMSICQQGTTINVRSIRRAG